MEGKGKEIIYEDDKVRFVYDFDYDTELLEHRLTFEKFIGVDAFDIKQCIEVDRDEFLSLLPDWKAIHQVSSGVMEAEKTRIG